jgi:hypothetical protein
MKYTRNNLSLIIIIYIARHILVRKLWDGV